MNLNLSVLHRVVVHPLPPNDLILITSLFLTLFSCRSRVFFNQTSLIMTHTTLKRCQRCFEDVVLLVSVTLISSTNREDISINFDITDYIDSTSLPQSITWINDRYYRLPRHNLSYKTPFLGGCVNK